MIDDKVNVALTRTFIIITASKRKGEQEVIKGESRVNESWICPFFTPPLSALCLPSVCGGGSAVGIFCDLYNDPQRLRISCGCTLCSHIHRLSLT